MKYLTAVFIYLIFISCSKERKSTAIQLPGTCDSINYPGDKKYTFIKDILPIFEANCNFTECHASEGVGGYDFKEYTVVANRVRAGTIEYRLDLPLSDPQHMPQKMRLNVCDYYVIKSWIRQNFPEK